MKQVLLFGAGKSATFLIDFLLQNAVKENWFVTIADADPSQVALKIKDGRQAAAHQLDIHNSEARQTLIQSADIVISLMPPSLHLLIAKDCVVFGKNLLTASYIDDGIRQLEPEIEKKGLLFLCEMGLDPGIDHMSAMRIIDKIHASGGVITSFKSHCGGLVAPESDDNPWHYKISWNPRNIIQAGKAGATYMAGGAVQKLSYENLFDGNNLVEIPGIGIWGYYPNRDVSAYIKLYGLQSAGTFIRTTLRHPDFMYGWKNIIDLGLTDETTIYQTDGLSLADFFKQHLAKNGFDKWLDQQLAKRFSDTKSMLENLVKLMEAEKAAETTGEAIPETLMMVDQQGDLASVELEDVKNNAAAMMAHKMHEANLILKQLFYLGMDDHDTLINKGACTAADVLQLALEKKLALLPGDKDMIVMMHEIEYTRQEQTHTVQSSLVVKGEDHVHTAMAKTVGLPLGIAAKLILDKKIKLTGLHIPTNKIIYEPVLQELHAHGIIFHEVES